MRHLVMRYMDSLLEPFNSAVHVVDPLLLLRHRVGETKAVQENLDSRRIIVDALKIKTEYEDWLKAFKIYCENNKTLESRNYLLEKSNGLISALSIPNILDTVENLDQERAVQKGNQRYHLTTEPLNKRKFKSQIIDSVRKMIHNHSTKAIYNLKAPYLVRETLLDVCNISNSKHLLVCEGTNSYFRLVGVSLPSLISTFLQQKLTCSNKMPLLFYSTGTSYSLMQDRCMQNDVICLLLLTRTYDELLDMARELKQLMHILFSENFTEFKESYASPCDLEFYERAAFVLRQNAKELFRLSIIGSYISERCNMVFESDEAFNFINMGFVRINF